MLKLFQEKNTKSRLESAKIFKKVCKKSNTYTKIIEAELIKLFSNSYRYINFSISNQFYMMCKKSRFRFFLKIRNLMRDNYARDTNIPTAGFTAGPCLLKDTMQLSSFYNHKFSLFHSAMSINENLPIFIIKKLSEKYDLRKKNYWYFGSVIQRGK